MFRHVPECSVFRVLSTAANGRLEYQPRNKDWTQEKAEIEPSQMVADTYAPANLPYIRLNDVKLTITLVFVQPTLYIRSIDAV